MTLIALLLAAAPVNPGLPVDGGKELVLLYNEMKSQLDLAVDERACELRTSISESQKVYQRRYGNRMEQIRKVISNRYPQDFKDWSWIGGMTRVLYCNKPKGQQKQFKATLMQLEKRLGN
ncbi:hypothetical protein DXH95_06290 [Sphingorhabdus pulchriflava]|uniref:Uncharacterized protein n=1 Tax=Sphingorhabdus pulchriflava TaxID=2292257 RepID=A0A371BHC9_9SPHN|nr:hypothetical protein [Sphingorhabdus pulchriflava]RDV06995.1 hypothetical protein DXH95_06290 [Sphingorhabdus pulchriflava]